MTPVKAQNTCNNSTSAHWLTQSLIQCPYVRDYIQYIHNSNTYQSSHVDHCPADSQCDMNSCKFQYYYDRCDHSLHCNFHIRWYLQQIYLCQARKLLRISHKHKYGLNRYNGYINTVLTQAIMLICPQTVTNIARTGVERNHVCTDLTAPRTGFFAFINIYITNTEKAASDRDFVANTQRPASLLHICMNYSTPDFPLTLTWIGLLKLDIYRLDTD